MMQRRTFLPLLAAPLLAQDEAAKQVFRTTVNVVVAPVTVTDHDGRHVSGLEGKDFTLFDNTKVQDIKVDVSFVPISMVACTAWEVWMRGRERTFTRPSLASACTVTSRSRPSCPT